MMIIESVKSLNLERDYPLNKYTSFRLGIRKPTSIIDDARIVYTNETGDPCYIDWFYERFEGYTALMDALSLINFIEVDKDLDLVVEYPKPIMR